MILKIEHYRLLVAFTPLASGPDGQWLNFPTPGSPRTRDGKPDLAAVVSRAADGKPDLSGVGHVRPTSLAEMKRLYRDRAGETNLPVMEADAISKYAMNILVDFRPAESPMRPEAAEILNRHLPGTNPPIVVCATAFAAGLVSKLNEIVQSP